MSAVNEFKKILAEAQKQHTEKLKEAISGQSEPDTSIVQKAADYISNSKKSDTIPAEPSEIESQRWNDPLRREPGDKFVTFKEMNDHYGLFLQRIQKQMSTISGGGEVKFRYLDDINANTVGLNKFLTYDNTTKKFVFNSFDVANGLDLDANNVIQTKTSNSFGYETDGTLNLQVASETVLGGIKLGPGVELNGLDQIIINSEGLDFSFGDFFAYTANGVSGTTAAFLSSINENEDIVIQSNGTGQVDIIGRFGIYKSNGSITSADPVFYVNDIGDVSATTLNIVNTDDLGLVAPLNVTINAQGLTKTPAIVSGSVAQFTGRDDRTPIIVLDAYGIDEDRDITGGEFVFRSGRGTNENPAPIQANDIIGNITAAGWASDGYGGVGVGGIKIVADENFTSTTRGSRVEIYTTPMGTITPTRIVTIDDGGLSFNENDVTSISNVDYLMFDTSHIDSANTPGTLTWSSEDDTLNIHHSDGVTQQVGQELYGYVRNNTGTTIQNGTVVRFDGAETNGSARLEITPFIANGTYSSLYGFGITTQPIPNGFDGKVAVWGKARNLNTTGGTENWQVGDILYVSPNTAGNLTNIKPTAPNNVIPIGVVLRVDATEGEIFVRPTVEQKMSYGVFTRTTDLNPNQTNTAFTVGLTNTEISNGVSIGNPDSRLIVEQSGLYQIDVTAHFSTTGGMFDEDTWYTWIRKNGEDVPNTMRRGGIDGEVPNGVSPSFTRVLSLDAGEYVEICIAVSNTDVDLSAEAATSFGPSTAALEVSVSQIQL